MKTLASQTRIGFQFVASDDNGGIQQIKDALLILIAQLRAWIDIQLAAEHQRIQFGLLAERALVLMTLWIEISSRILSAIIWLEVAPTAFLDWCEAVYLKSAALWGEVGFLFTGRLQYA